MANEIFTGLNTRFQANAALKAVGRRLYQGIGRPPNEAGPYTDLFIRRTSTLDTFTDDVDVYDCEFVFHSDGVMTTDSDTWCTEMIRSFAKTTVSVTGYDTAWVDVVEEDRAVLDEQGRYGARVGVELVLRRTSLLPASRGV